MSPEWPELGDNGGTHGTSPVKPIIHASIPGVQYTILILPVTRSRCDNGRHAKVKTTNYFIRWRLAFSHKIKKNIELQKHRNIITNLIGVDLYLIVS